MKKANIFNIFLSLSAFVLLSFLGFDKSPAQETDHQGTAQTQRNHSISNPTGSLFNLNTLLSLSITQQTMGDPVPFIDLQYSYDGVGNITSIQDLMNANNSITMQYDSLDRLTTANGPWQNGSFTYDALGNRTSSVIGTNTATYDYDPVTNRLQNLTYDNNGNVTNDGFFTYTYDSENRITQITNGTDVITYKYDGDGRRISQTVNGEKTIYAYGTGLNVLTEFNESGIPKVDYIYAGTRTVAREEFDESGNPVKKTFYHTDHLGSTKAITNLESTQIWKQGYLPYGGSYNNEVNPYDQITNTHQYTGKEVEGMVGEEGTYYYRARYYRPDLGRFMSTDPGPVDITNPQTFNRYSYVNNNPFSSVDPDGRVAVPLICDIATEGGNLASLLFGDVTDAFIAFGAVDPSNPNLAYTEALSETFEDFSFYTSFCSVRGLGKEGVFGVANFANKARNTKKVIFIGKLNDLENIPRGKTLLPELPNLGNAKANFKQNSSVLRKKLREGFRIKDLSFKRSNTDLDPTKFRPDRKVGQSFLGAERIILENKGLKLNSKTGFFE